MIKVILRGEVVILTRPCATVKLGAHVSRVRTLFELRNSIGNVGCRKKIDASLLIRTHVGLGAWLYVARRCPLIR